MMNIDLQRRMVNFGRFFIQSGFRMADFFMKLRGLRGVWTILCWNTFFRYILQENCKEIMRGIRI